MKFLIAEILIWLIAASILGLVVGWLFKAVSARRKLDWTNKDWDKQYTSLKTSLTQQITALEESASAQQSENNTLRSKVSSLSAMVKSMETALQKANAENRTLSTTVTSQQLTINEVRIESETLIKRQSALQMELNALELAKEQENNSLKRQLGQNTKNDSTDSGTDTGNPAHTDKQPVMFDSSKTTSANSTNSHLAPVLSTPDEIEPNDIDQKIKALNEQRDRLNREREALFNQEQHFAAQLTRGDDTEAYLDQTIRIDDDITGSIQTDTPILNGGISITDENKLIEGENDRADSLASASTSHLAHQTDRPKSLWDKFKTSVNQPTDKSKT